MDGYIISDNVYETFLMSRGSNISYGDLDHIKPYFQNLDSQGIISSGWTSAQIEDKGYLVKYYNYGVL